MHAAAAPAPPRRRWQTRGRCAVLLAGLTMLAGCAGPVEGTPHGAAGFGPVPSPARSAPAQRVDGVDTCTLLKPDELARIGGAEGEPRRDALLPESCAYDLAGGAAGDVAAVAWYKPLDQARGQAPGGTLVQSAGRPTWLTCDVDDGYQSCSAAVAVRPDRTLLVLLSRRDVSEVRVGRDLQALTATAVSRLPAASPPIHGP